MQVTKKAIIGLALSALSFTTVNATIKNAGDFFNQAEVELFDIPIGDGYRSTTWYSKPFTVDSPSDRSKKPRVMTIFVESTGYYGAFANPVTINCSEPTKSFIHLLNDNKKISLKESMSYPDTPEKTFDTTFKKRIDRDVVEAIFSHYCS